VPAPRPMTPTRGSAVFSRSSAEHVADRPVAVVVGRRLAGTGRIDALAAVDRPAVHQHAELPVGREQHPLDAEEVAFDVQRTALRAGWRGPG